MNKTAIRERQITVSAPGKIIFAGEHSVVYGKPAILTAVGKRVKVTLVVKKVESGKLKVENSIKIIDKTLKIREENTLEEILEFTEKAKERWGEFAKTGEVGILKGIVKNPLDLVRVAIGETIGDWQQAISNKQKVTGNKLARHKAQVIENFELEIESEIPIGRGMGSSAALVAAVVGAIYLLVQSAKCKVQNQVKSSEPINYVLNNNDLEIIHQIAINAERKIHGNPSGGDTAAVIYGGTVWFRKNADGSRTITPIKIPDEAYDEFTLLDSGKPLETTGEMVAEVRKKIKARPRWGKEILEKIEEASMSFKKGLEEKNKLLIEQAIFQNERCLEKLGVVSPSTKEIIRKLKDFGIAAKVSGAGGKKEGSGMVLCYGEGVKVRDLAKKLGVEVVEGEFGGRGIEVSLK